MSVRSASDVNATPGRYGQQRRGGVHSDRPLTPWWWSHSAEWSLGSIYNHTTITRLPPMEPLVLSEDDIQHFLDRNFVIVRDAIPLHIIERCAARPQLLFRWALCECTPLPMRRRASSASRVCALCWQVRGADLAPHGLRQARPGHVGGEVPAHGALHVRVAAGRGAARVRGNL